MYQWCHNCFIDILAQRNAETQELQGPIDNWHDMHYRSNGGWVNDLAEKDYVSNLLKF